MNGLQFRNPTRIRFGEGAVKILLMRSIILGKCPSCMWQRYS